MKLQARRSPLLFLVVAVVKQIVRRPYLSASVAAHVALLALLYNFGSYQLELRQQQAEMAEVASSLRATSEASTAKRLQDLQTIKQLLEKSADRVEPQPEPSPAPLAAPQTPDQMVARARELSKAIDALDKDIKAEELARLTGVPKPPPVTEPPPAAVPQAPVAQTPAASDNAGLEPKEPKEGSAPDKPAQQLEAKVNDGQADAGQADAGQASGSTQAPVTQEMADSEVAALEAKARATLAKRQERLEAKANGVQVEGHKPGSGEEGAGGSPAAPTVKGRKPDPSVRAEIADFIGAGDRVEQTTRSTSYAGQNAEFFDRGKHQIPPVDATSLVLGRGSMLGAGGEYANRVYLNSWYIIGPFAGRHGWEVFDSPSYPPEKAVLLDAVYFGKDKRLLKWRYVTAQSYPLVPPDQVEDSVYYGYTEVFVDQASDLIAWIGADDDVQIYLNDHLVWKGGNVNKASYFDAIFNTSMPYLRDYNRSEGKRVPHFNKGRNKLFFKLSNGPNDAFLSMVLTR